MPKVKLSEAGIARPVLDKMLQRRHPGMGVILAHLRPEVDSSSYKGESNSNDDVA